VQRRHRGRLRAAASFRVLLRAWNDSVGAYSNMHWNPAYAGFQDSDIAITRNPNWEMMMGKYLIAWLLGVPAIVLVGIYAFTHLV
jgi:hypothetical protein